MRKLPFKILCLSLAMLTMASFCACGDKKDKNEDSQSSSVDAGVASYSEKTEKYAEEVIYSLMEYGYKKVLSDGVSDAALETLKVHAKNFKDQTMKKPMDEDMYLTFIQKLEEKGKAVIDEVLAYSANGSGTLTQAKSLYISLSTLLGADYVASTAYYTCLYAYDFKYQKLLSDYDKYGYAFLLEDADLLAKERKVFAEKIGESNFICVLRNAFTLSDLFFDGGLQSTQLSAFTDAQILMFVRAVDLSSLTIDAEGWQLILSKAIPDTISATSGYFLQLAKVAKTYDLSALSAVMPDAMKLLSAMLGKVDTAEVALIRAGDYQGAVQSVFKKLGEVEWTAFEKVTTCAITAEKYDEVATRCYGENYETYKAGMQTKTLAEVKAKANDADFYDTLKGYIAGISPAFSYKM